MKLNERQVIALAIWLGSKFPNIAINPSKSSELLEFTSDRICEWRVTGDVKLVNQHDHLYLTTGPGSGMDDRILNIELQTLMSWC